LRYLKISINIYAQIEYLYQIAFQWYYRTYYKIVISYVFERNSTHFFQLISGAFGASTGGFGTSGGTAFGAAAAKPAFGAFGAATTATPTFGSTAPAFGAASTGVAAPSFGFGTNTTAAAPSLGFGAPTSTATSFSGELYKGGVRGAILYYRAPSIV
jgi:hypothetical protein